MNNGVPENHPFVSVIIPVFNDPQGIANLIGALANQTYPVFNYEVIVVDNGSTDITQEVANSSGQSLNCKFTFTEECSIQGSYAARNKGLKIAQGSVIAFTDSDCTPCPDWIKSGVDTLQKEKADLAGGHVRFTFKQQKPNAAEFIDSRTNMQMERDIEIRGITKTANLFVRRSVIESIGPFPAHLKSGGDVQWTGRATKAGHKLVFAHEAEVTHPARSWKDVFVKQLRVGRGHIPVMRKSGMSWMEIIKESLQTGKPANKSFRSQYPQAPLDWEPCKLAKMCAKLWSRGSTLLGRINYTITHLNRLP
ncbi:glycosyltransferase [Pelagicoccus albus]|uniref:Glycosyltransferase family 2 protein n=1 Tax=Pelagicoccus albus TaxID=415222 RepID=A0A7X1B5N3_9BACT|nr:glycosyltransferase family A protein [Pelagicoccus albus]MBC2605829.1 glycosyltransferase family 2 protein [Pelagicoccus albus]